MIRSTRAPGLIAPPAALPVLLSRIDPKRYEAADESAPQVLGYRTGDER